MQTYDVTWKVMYQSMNESFHDQDSDKILFETVNHAHSLSPQFKQPHYTIKECNHP